jgi:hypothetical protein
VEAGAASSAFPSKLATRPETNGVCAMGRGAVSPTAMKAEAAGLASPPPEDGAAVPPIPEDGPLPTASMGGVAAPALALDVVTASLDVTPAFVTSTCASDNPLANGGRDTTGEPTASMPPLTLLTASALLPLLPALFAAAGNREGTGEPSFTNASKPMWSGWLCACDGAGSTFGTLVAVGRGKLPSSVMFSASRTVVGAAVGLVPLGGVDRRRGFDSSTPLLPRSDVEEGLSVVAARLRRSGGGVPSRRGDVADASRRGDTAASASAGEMGLSLTMPAVRSVLSFLDGRDPVRSGVTARSPFVTGASSVGGDGLRLLD